MAAGNSEYDVQTLIDALARARKLVESLEHTKAQTDETASTNLDCEQVAAGRQAIDHALAAARRALAALDAAHDAALLDHQEPGPASHVHN